MCNVIYLDNNSTTRLDPRVLDGMMPYLTEQFANATSTHFFGEQANKAINAARAQVAALVGCEYNELIFTSGATEAINLAIKGVIDCYKEKGNHILTVSTEHPAVLDTCKYLESIGYEVTYLPVENNGLLNLELLKQNIRNNTLLVSVMYVNNVTGVIQPIQEIAQIAHSKGALFMTDGTQATGKIHVNIDELDIDLMSFSAHKFYGPKGIGALYFRNKQSGKVKLNSIIHGGKHEYGLRSGTLNVPGIVGFGKAAEIAQHEMKRDEYRIKELRDYLETELLKIKNTILNGHPERRIYNTCNICFKGIDAYMIIKQLKNIAVSNGSACASALIEPSHVLLAQGLNRDDAFSSLRFSLGRFNTKQEIISTIKEFSHKLDKLLKTPSYDSNNTQSAV